MKTVKTILLSLLFTLSVSVSAQIVTGIKPTGKHARHFNHLKLGKKALNKEERKALRDSLKAWKRLDRLAGKKLDSLYRARKQWNKYQEKLETQFDKHATNETIDKIKSKAKKRGVDVDDSHHEILKRALGKGRDDSLSVKQRLKALQAENSVQKTTAEDQLSKVRGIKEGSSVVDDKGKLIREYSNKVPGDSIFRSPESISRVVEEELEQRAGSTKAFEEIKKYADEANQFDVNSMAGPIDAATPTETLKQKATRGELIARAEKLLNNSEAFEGIQHKMTSLKKKYSTVPDAGDLSSAVKRNSLEEEPLKKRLVFGGNFQVISTDPFAIDASPTVTYQINKKWQAGIGFNYRQTFGSDSLVNAAENLWAIRGFTRYLVWKDFFGYTEYERSFKNAAANREGGTRLSEGVNAINLGIGRQFKLFEKITGTVLLTYDVIHQPGKSVNRRPFNVRFGFDVER